MKIFNDIYNFIMALRFVDIVFYFSILILMILIVILIYFIRINKMEEDEKNKLGETQEMKIAKELRDNMKSNDKMIQFTDYEKDQEDKAIISYDELLNKENNNYELNYETEEMHDDLSVKKVDLGNLVNKSNNAVSNLEVRVISFQKEEAFLSFFFFCFVFNYFYNCTYCII